MGQNIKNLTTDIYHTYLVLLYSNLKGNITIQTKSASQLMSNSKLFNSSYVTPNSSYNTTYIVEKIEKYLRIYKDRTFYSDKDIKNINSILTGSWNIKDIIKEIGMDDFKTYRRKFICKNISTYTKN